MSTPLGERPRVAAELVPVRDLIRDELRFRGIAEDRVITTLRRFMASDDPMSPKVAQLLAAMFGTSADLWINFDAAYRSAQS